MTSLAPLPSPTPPPSLSPAGRTGLRAVVVIAASLILLAGLFPEGIERFKLAIAPVFGEK